MYACIRCSVEQYTVVKSTKTIAKLPADAFSEAREKENQAG
jgi:hypothetical protein